MDRRESFLSVHELRDVDLRLLNAAKVNDKETCRFAVLDGANPNASLHGYFSAVHTAAECGFTDVLEAIVSAGRQVGRAVDLDAASPFGETPLLLAVRFDRGGVLKRLLEYGADPDVRSIYRRTPVHVAALLDRELSVRLLVRAGANVNAVDCFYQTPLCLAIMSGASVDIVRRLLLAGADPNFRCRTTKPLLSSAVLGCMVPRDLPPLVFLLSAGADPRARDRVKLDTALHHAAETGFLQAIDLLVAAGGELEAENAYGETPLNVAIKFGNRHVALHLFYLEEELEERELRRLQRRHRGGRSQQSISSLYF